MQVSGLRTISTRNLSLASRCLQLVRLHLPLLREHFAALISPLKEKPATDTSSAPLAHAGNGLPGINVAKHVDSLFKVLHLCCMSLFAIK